MRLALTGPPGSGKSTAARLLVQLLQKKSRQDVHVLKIAEPLYKLQNTIYKTARVELSTEYEQDGELLQYLGSKLRKINPDCLSNNFAERLDRLQNSHDSIVICDDARPLDIPHLLTLGFIIIKITSRHSESRVIERNDLTRQDPGSALEMGYSELSGALEIDNSGSTQDLEAHLSKILDEIL